MKGSCCRHSRCNEACKENDELIVRKGSFEDRCSLTRNNDHPTSLFCKTRLPGLGLLNESSNSLPIQVSSWLMCLVYTHPQISPDHDELRVDDSEHLFHEGWDGMGFRGDESHAMMGWGEVG